MKLLSAFAVLTTMITTLGTLTLLSGCAPEAADDTTRPALPPPPAATNSIKAPQTASESIIPEPEPAATPTVSQVVSPTVPGITPVTPLPPAEPGSVRAQNQALVKACFDKTALGAIEEPRYRFKETCRLPDKFYTGRTAYRVSREADAIHVTVKINLMIVQAAASASGTKQQLLENIRGCIAPIRNVWGRYGIKFDLSFDAEAQSGEFHHQVQLLDEYCDRNPDESSFCYKGWRGREATRQLDVCRMILHETGHMLGLEDEYLDPNCPDRPFVSKETQPWSIMNNEWFPLADLDFYPRHVKTLLGPLCSQR